MLNYFGVEWELKWRQGQQTSSPSDKKCGANLLSENNGLYKEG